MHPRKHFPPISTFWKLHTSRFLLALLPSPNVGHSPPLNEKSPKIVFKMGKKKRLNLAFLTQNSCSLGDFSLDVIGSYPPPPPPTHPLTENHFARKKLSRIGGAPSLTEKIRYVVFDGLPNQCICLAGGHGQVWQGESGWSWKPGWSGLERWV